MKKIAKTLPIILAVICLCGLLLGQPLALVHQPPKSPIDQIDQAVRAGRIDLKTAVLQKAKFLFGPQRVVLEGDDIGDETPRLELFEDIRRVFEQLTNKEKDYLISLDRDLARVVNQVEYGEETEEASISPRFPNTIDRVSRAQEHGEISLKEATLLKARLLFTPHAIAREHSFSVQVGEVPAEENCLTGFYKDVHRVFDQLAYEEISFLRSLSPDLEAIMTTREQEQAGGVRAWRRSVLPSYPHLDQQEEGKRCVVHYTLTGADAAPDNRYAELVRLYMDKAISSDMTKNFTKAFAEGYPDFKGKMHVYLMDIGALGSWVDESPVSGKAKAGYILLSTKLKDRFPESWQLLMKGECFHEYFHGIQSAYNWESDRWFLEATSTWAMGYYANDFMHIKPLYNGSNSIFTLPNDILWSMVGARQYSASALAFYLSEKFDGHKIIKSYLVNSITEKDAIKNLQQILLAKGTTFSEEYTCFLASLFSKKITSIKKYMPDVSIATTHNTYGLDTTTGNVFLTGANFHVFDPEAGVQPASFIANFTAGTTGVPRGVLVKQKSKTPIPFQAHAVIGSPAAYVGDFGGNVEQVVLIVTDTDYSAQDTDLRPYEYTAIVPRVVVKEVLAQSPIYSGESSQIDITYDLLGTFPGKPFPAQLKVTEKGPDVTDNASGEGELASGVDQILGLWFSTSWDTVGTYRFTFQLAVPPDSWLPIPQVKSKGRCSVVVEEPPEESAVGQLQPKVQTESAALRIRR